MLFIAAEILGRVYLIAAGIAPATGRDAIKILIGADRFGPDRLRRAQMEMFRVTGLCDAFQRKCVRSRRCAAVTRSPPGRLRTGFNARSARSMSL
jgi:hypothetical protein